MKIKTKIIISALITASLPFSYAAARPRAGSLDCAKSSGATAERLYLDAASGGGNMYIVNVTFTAKKPTNSEVEVALRDCIVAAIKKDWNKDVLASGWFKRRHGASDNDDVKLDPWGPMRFISYTATTRKIEVRQIKLVKK